MPVRLLWPTLRTSERWQRARYFDRCFYISLLNLVDDYGRYEANPALLASECFPYGGEDGLPITVSAIDGALRSLASKDLLVVYQSDGKQFLELRRFRERKRSKSKWPSPETSEIVWKSENCCQLPANDSKCQQVLASPSPSPSPSGTTNNGHPSLEEVQTIASMRGIPAEEAERFWNQFESSGWIDKNGNPIVKWESKLALWASDARARKIEKSRSTGKYQKPKESASEAVRRILKDVA